MHLGAEIVLALSAALAQESQDPVERSVQRAKERLQLTDEQTAKAREIYKKQNDDLRSILTDEQKKRMDEDRGGRGQGGPQGGPPGGAPRGGSWLPSTDDLKAKISLTDDQVSKINEVRDAARQQVRDFFRNRGRGGNPGDEWAAFESKIREDVSGKIRGLLTDEQKPKFEDLLKAAAAAVPSQDGRSSRGGAEDRTTRAMEALKISDAKEAEAVKGLVSKVAGLMDKVEGLQRELRTKVEEMARNSDLSDEAIGDRVGEQLKAVREAEKELAAARRELTDVVSNRQELELLRRGLLR